MQLNGTYSYNKESDTWSEPLNLVKKKTKPVAVVAPSSVVDKSSEKYQGFIPDPDTAINTYKTQTSSDNLFKSKKTYEEASSLFENTSAETKEISSHSDKNEDGREKEEKVSDEEDSVERSSVKSERNRQLAETMTSLQLENNINKNGFLSIINDLAANEHSFLTALYMNSLLNIPSTNGLHSPFSSSISNYLLSAGYNNHILGAQTESCSTGVTTSPAFNNLWSLSDMQQRLWQMANWQERQQNNSHSSNSVCESVVPKIGTSKSSTNMTDNSTTVSAAQKVDSPEKSTTVSSSKTTVKKPRSNPKGSSSMDQKISTSSGADGNKTQESGQTSNNQDKKKPHIKKPLNAFMLYMKEMRAKVVAECTLKESAAINQILGRRWHALGREEQAKYYELARRERQLHMQLYPDWSSRANSSRGKKRKRKQETNDGGNSMKKCRARYGLDQQSQWCKPCSPDGPGHGNPPGHAPGPGPTTGLGVHASIIHHGNTATSNAASPQEPTYVNL